MELITGSVVLSEVDSLYSTAKNMYLRKNQLVPQSVYTYSRGVAKPEVIITGISSLSNAIFKEDE